MHFRGRATFSRARNRHRGPAPAAPRAARHAEVGAEAGVGEGAEGVGREIRNRI